MADDVVDSAVRAWATVLQALDDLRSENRHLASELERFRLRHEQQQQQPQLVAGDGDAGGGGKGISRSASTDCVANPGGWAAVVPVVGPPSVEEMEFPTMISVSDDEDKSVDKEVTVVEPSPPVGRVPTSRRASASASAGSSVRRKEQRAVTVASPTPELPGLISDVLEVKAPRRLSYPPLGDPHALRLRSPESLTRNRFEKPIAWVQERLHHETARERVKAILKRHDEGTGYLSARELQAALEEKAPGEIFEEEELCRIIAEMRAIYQKLRHKTEPPMDFRSIPFDTIPIEALVEVICTPSVSRFAHNLALKRGVSRVVHALAAKSVDEIIDETARVTMETQVSSTGVGKLSFRNPARTLDAWVSLVVSLTVVINLVCTGLSVDFDPNSTAWLLVEVSCCVVFVAEVTYKIRRMGATEYFRGDLWRWNIFDFFVTLMALGDVLLSLTMLVIEGFGDMTRTVASASRLALVFRAFRLIRILRIVKVAQSPMMRDLANMVQGCLLGIPSLSWLLILFCLNLYITGMVFRLIIGPKSGTSYIEQCGMNPDELDESTDNCILHYMYGEEYFGTVAASMFTAFRFMLSDYSTAGGKSLVVALERGYGNNLRVPFVIWMIVVIFGMFNVITAVFVDATSTGLRHSDMKRKYARMYEREYVKGKLKALLDRLSLVINVQQPGKDGQRSRPSTLQSGLGKVTIRLEQFVCFFEDQNLRNILQDLDVDVWDPTGLFDTCDTDDTGEVTVEDFIRALLKLRGEPQKSDIISSFLAIRSVQHQLEQLATRLEHPHPASSRAGSILAMPERMSSEPYHSA